MNNDSPRGLMRIFMNEPPAPKPSWVFSEAEEGQGTAENWFTRILFNSPPPRRRVPIPSCLTPRNDEVFWGMQDITVEAAARHQLIIGAPGSGKTVSIELYLQSLVHRLRSPVLGQTPEKLILLDVKGTFYSFLTAQGVPEQDIQILDPFDQRCLPWNIARDINSDAGAERLAALLIPAEEKASTSFFWQAARAVVRAVIIALIELLPGRWSLRDLLNSLSTPDHIQRLLSRVPRACAKAEPFLKDTVHFPSVFTTIVTKAFRFETVAALWHQSGSTREFSVADWFSADESRQRHGVLLLGHRPKHLESITPLNGLLLRMISDELQSWPDVTRPHTWIVLDEFRWMKDVDCMAELLGVGRSKGASILLGLQDVSGMRHVYGPDRADEILGMCENKTFLRVGNAATAEWASKYFGDREATEMETSITYGKETSTTESKKVVTRPLFLNAEFTNLEVPQNRPGSRIQGIHHIPSMGNTYSIDEEAQVIYKMNRKPSAEHLEAHPNQINRPAADEILRPWKPAEEESILGPAPVATPPNAKPAKSVPVANNGSHKTTQTSPVPNVGEFFRRSLDP